MKLGELIREYRETHGYSQRQFAKLCGLSNGYISMLEKGYNPKTRKPITPTIPQMKKLADGMGSSLTVIFQEIDEMPIALPSDIESILDRNYYLQITGYDGSLYESMITKEQFDRVKCILEILPDDSSNI